MTQNHPNYSGKDANHRLRQADRLARILRLLQFLLGRGKWNAKSLAQEQECSERTIYRDLNVLELAGVPWYFDAEKGFYSVRTDYKFPVLNLTDEEILGQATATTIAGATGLKIGQGAKPITKKLAAGAREDIGKLLDDAARIVAVLDLKMADHSRHQEIIRTIQWSLLQGKQLAGQYASPYQNKPVKLLLHPFRLCLIQQAWYLIAQPVKGEQPKTYRVARFKSLRMLDQPAQVSQDFKLQSYFGNAWGVFRGNQTFDVEIEFTPEAAPLVTETTWHHTQKTKWHRDGSVILSFRVDGLGEILWWVLSWTGRARIIKPQELRDMVAQQLREGLRLNQP